MKIFKLSFLMILAISVLSSCAKKATPAPAAPSQSMSATLNGTNWTASSVNSINNSGILGVVGSGSNGTSFEIELPASATASTDSLPSTGSYGILYATGSSSYAMSKGAIVVTSNAGNTISGTFSGTLTDISGSGSPITVTNGAFTGKY